MLRPTCIIGRKLAEKCPKKDFVRRKVIQPPAFLNQIERIKLWNKENKELFGPLLESSKQKKQRLQKAGKCINLYGFLFAFNLQPLLVLSINF